MPSQYVPSINPVRQDGAICRNATNRSQAPTPPPTTTMIDLNKGRSISIWPWRSKKANDAANGTNQDRNPSQAVRNVKTVRMAPE